MKFSEEKTLLQSLDYPVPAHANSILYMFGGISLAAFLILIASGIYLSQIYSPTPENAYESVIYAVTNTPLADFMRSIHYWTANLVVFLLLLHITRVFITGAYKGPRRLTWLTGVALLGITTVYIFIGTVLKWDQEGVEAFGHMKETLEIFGLTIGITNQNIPVITQLYPWHTTILLLLLIGLIAVHMLLIKLRGISPKPTEDAVAISTAGQGSSSFLVHLKRLTGYSLLFFAIAGLFAVVFPAPIGMKGLLGQEVSKPSWMFWPFFGLENIFGLKSLVFGMFGFFILLAAVPFIDRNQFIHYAKRKTIIALGLVFTLIVIGLGVYSQLYTPQPHLSEMETAPMEQKASAEPVNISHERLRSEAYFLLPLLAVVVLSGMGLIIKKDRNHKPNTHE